MCIGACSTSVLFDLYICVMYCVSHMLRLCANWLVRMWRGQFIACVQWSVAITAPMHIVRDTAYCVPLAVYGMPWLVVPYWFLLSM